jgi:hypothetical protein
MRAGRIVTALLAAAAVAGIVYAALLAYQVASLGGGPRKPEIALSSAVMATIALAFAVVVLLPLSLFAQRRTQFRPIVIGGGVAVWFGASLVALMLMGQGATEATSGGLQLLALGLPVVATFAAILGKGPHA